METFKAADVLVFDGQATLTSVMWKTSNRVVSTVTTAGLVTAKILGNAVITATAANGLAASFTVRVVAVKTEAAVPEAPMADAGLAPQPSITEDPQPTAAPQPETIDAPATAPARLCLANADCTVGDDTVVAVDASAQVIPLAAGESLVACDAAQLTLLVDDTPRIVRIRARVGDGFRLLADADECWLAEDETVAEVDDQGRINLLAAGETLLALTRADGTVAETIRLIVEVMPPPVETPAVTEEPPVTPSPSETLAPPDSTPPGPIPPTEPPISEPPQTEPPTPAPTDTPTPEPTAPTPMVEVQPDEA